MNKLRPLYVILLLTTACSINESHEMCVETHNDIAIMDKQTGIWIIPQEDPYRIDPTSTKSTPKATHYAMTIHPKSVSEQRDLERMNDLGISYIPFGYSFFKQPDNLPESEDNTNKSEPIDGCCKPTIGIEDPLPTLYVTWPISKEIPQNMDYTIEYESCLPAITIDQTDPDELANSIDTKALTARLGRLRFQDSFMTSELLAIQNVIIRFQYGSSIQNVNTSSMGYFTVPSGLHDSTSVSYVLQGSDWTISSDNSTVPTIKYLGKLAALWGNSQIKNFSVSGLHESCYRAAHYLYTTSFSGLLFPLPLFNDITIKIQSSTSSVWGEFYYGANPAYIKIYPHGTYGDQEIVSTTLHELGHAMHYKFHYSNYTSTEKVLRESFGSFCGWYFGEKYYESIGWVKPYSSYTLNSNHRQYWTETDTTTVYTPFFVDLVDDYNQSSIGSLFLWDDLSEHPLSEIINIAKANTLEQAISKSKDSYHAPEYTSEEVFEYTQQYRHWKNRFVHYPPDWWN